MTVRGSNILHQPYEFKIVSPLLDSNGNRLFLDLTKPPYDMIDWKPSAPEYKSGGTFLDSPLSQGRALVNKEFGNITDKISLAVATNDVDGSIRAVQEIRRYLELASDYWVQNWNDDFCYLQVRNRQESNTRYAIIVRGAIPQDAYPFGRVIHYEGYQKRALMAGLDVIIEHGLWLDQVPGEGQLIEISSQDSAVFSGTDNETVGAGSDDAEANESLGTLNLTDSVLRLGEAGAPSTKRVVCLRFTGIDVPQGATITSSFVTFEASSNNSGTLQVIVRGDDTDNAATFSTYANYTGRTRTTAVNYWNESTAWVTGNTYNTADISAIIQEIVSRPGWVSGNAIALFFEGRSGARVARSYNLGAGFAPDIEINWELPVGQEETTDAETVFVANKQNEHHISHIYNYDSSAGTFGSNLATNPTAELFPNPAGNGDIIYFGIDPSPLTTQVFDSLVFDIGTVAAGTYTITWEYYSSAGPGWAAISAGSFRDDTGDFQNTGVQSVTWSQATNWTTVAINGVTAFWVRARISAFTSMTTNAVIQNRSIYAITLPFVDIANDVIEGDIGALIAGISRGQIDATLACAGFYVGARTVARGSAFKSFVGVNYNGQTGISIDGAGGGGLTARSTGTPGGETLGIPISASLTARVRLTFNVTAASNYEGRFRVFARYDDSNVDTARLVLYYESDTANPVRTGDERAPSGALSDFGEWVLPSIPFRLEIETTNAVASDFIDIVLIPVDEWAAKYYYDQTTTNALITDEDSQYLVWGDASTDPKNAPESDLLSTADDSLVTTYVRLQNNTATLKPRTNIRLWFFLIDGTGSAPYASKTSLQIKALQRYLSSRGNR